MIITILMIVTIKMRIIRIIIAMVKTMIKTAHLNLPIMVSLQQPMVRHIASGLPHRSIISENSSNGGY